MLSAELQELRDNLRAIKAGIRQVERDIAWNRVIDSAIRMCRVLCKAELAELDVKYRADQPRVPAGNPDGGQWTDVGGAGGIGLASGEGDESVGDEQARTQEAQAGGRGGTPWVTVMHRGRLLRVTPQQEVQLLLLQSQLSTTRENVRRLDPAWRLPAFARSREATTGESEIAALRTELQFYQARELVVQRGGVPLGFNNRSEFHSFSRTTYRELAASGNGGTEVYIRGSAVSGYKYTTGAPFDVGRRSDYDLAIVSESLYLRAVAIGVRTRGSGTRTAPLVPDQIRRLRLDGAIARLSEQADRKVGFVIYRTRNALEERGPALQLP